MASISLATSIENPTENFFEHDKNYEKIQAFDFV